MMTSNWINSLAADWGRFMLAGLVDSALVLAVAGTIWWLIRRRASAQLGYWLFLLVLLRLVVPVQLPVPAWAAAWTPKHLVSRTASRALPSAPPIVPQGIPAMSPSDAWAPQPPMRPVRPARPEAEPADPMSQTSTRDLLSGAASDATGAGPSGARSDPLTPLSILMIGWASIVGLGLLYFARSQWYVFRLVRGAMPLDPDLLDVDLRQLCTLAGLRRPIEILVSRTLASPAVCGVLRPRLLVPPGTLELAPQQMTWVLLHELAHVRRGDIRTVLFQKFVQIIYFFSPPVWLANWAIDQLREYACDDAALLTSGASRRDCGEGFLKVVLQASRDPDLATTPVEFLSRSGFIRRRLVRILDNNRTLQTRLSVRAVVLLLVVGVLTIPSVRASSRTGGTASTMAGSQLQASEETISVSTPRVAATNLVFQAFPPEFADYYTTQRLPLHLSEPLAFCRSQKPLRFEALANCHFQALLDESGGTGSGYDTLYINLNNDGDFANSPVHKAAPTCRRTGLEGGPLVGYFDNVYVTKDPAQGEGAHVQILVERDDSSGLPPPFIMNLIPARWAVGSVQVNGRTIPAAMFDGTMNDRLTNRRGAGMPHVNRMSPGNDAGALRGDFIVLGLDGESQLVPGDPNGWPGEGGSARMLCTQYVVLDSGIHEVQAEQNEQGVRLELTPAHVPTGIIDLGQVPAVGRLAMFGKQTCVLVSGHLRRIEVPEDMYYIPAMGAFVLLVPAGGTVALVPPTGWDAATAASFHPSSDRDQILRNQVTSNDLSTGHRSPPAVPKAPPAAGMVASRRLDLQVIASVTRQPIIGAAIDVRTCTAAGCLEAGLGSRTFKTDSSGRCTIPLPPGNLVYVGLLAKVDGCVPSRIAWRYDSMPGQYTWIVEPASSVGGIVRNASGQPIVDAKVTLCAADTRVSPGARPALEDVPVYTDKQGRWRCDTAPAGSRRMIARIEHPDYVTDTEAVELPLEPLRQMAAIVTMQPGVSLTGQVVDYRGKPVEDAMVRYGPNWRPTQILKTGGEGRFRINGIKAGLLPVMVQADGLALCLEHITVGPDRSPVVIRLEPGHTIRGRVIDTDGNPVSLADVVLNSWQGNSSLWWTTKTDAQGRFCWNGAPSDGASFDIAREGYSPVSDRWLAADRDEQVITLLTPLESAGRAIGSMLGADGGSSGR